MDGEDDLRSEATTRVDWTTGEPLRKASPAAEPATVPAEPVVAPPRYLLFQLLRHLRLQQLRHLHLLRIQILFMKLQQNLLPQWC